MLREAPVCWRMGSKDTPLDQRTPCNRCMVRMIKKTMFGTNMNQPLFPLDFQGKRKPGHQPISHPILFPPAQSNIIETYLNRLLLFCLSSLKKWQNNVWLTFSWNSTILLHWLCIFKDGKSNNVWSYEPNGESTSIVWFPGPFWVVTCFHDPE